MEYRRALLSMRKQREEELKAYKALCTKFNDSHLDLPLDLIKKRQALLTLELPFETDSVSVNEARLKFCGKMQDGDDINAALLSNGDPIAARFSEDWKKKRPMAYCSRNSLAISFDSMRTGGVIRSKNVI